jgi:hypothetical protein
MGYRWIAHELLIKVFECTDGMPSGRTEFPVAFVHSVNGIKSSAGKEINDMRKKRFPFGFPRPSSSALAELRETTRRSKCQALHDKIYAILALLKDFATFDSSPIDYNRSPFKVKMDVV